MGHDVEFEIGLSDASFEHLNAAKQKPCTFDVVTAPVVRENVECILIIAAFCAVPLHLTVAAFFEGRDKAFVDLGLGKEFEKLYAANDVFRDEVVAVAGKIRRNWKADVIVLCPAGLEPNLLAGLCIYKIRSGQARDDYHRRFARRYVRRRRFRRLAECWENGDEI